MARQQELVGQVEHQQGLHAVVGEPLPGLGEGHEPEPPRMAEKRAIVCGCGRNGHRILRTARYLDAKPRALEALRVQRSRARIWCATMSTTVFQASVAGI